MNVHASRCEKIVKKGGAGILVLAPTTKDKPEELGYSFSYH